MMFKGVRKLWDRYKYVALVVLIGAGLLLWPSGSSNTGQSAQNERTETRDLEGELAELLSQISGVGQARILLTEDTDGQRQLAQDTQLTYSGDVASPEEYSRRSETVLVDAGDRDETVVLQTQYPTYRGALVVCQGGDRAEVKLAVTEAVAALTGLSADRIVVVKCQ
jgi:stage III sporulation protein AG